MHADVFHIKTHSIITHWGYIHCTILHHNIFIPDTISQLNYRIQAFGRPKQTHAIFNSTHLFMARHEDTQRYDLNNKIYSMSRSVSHLETVAG